MGDNQRLVEEMLFGRVVEAALKRLHRPTLKTILRLPELERRLLGAYLTQPTRSGKESPESKAIRKTALDLYLEMCREMGSPPGKMVRGVEIVCCTSWEGRAASAWECGLCKRDPMVLCAAAAGAAFVPG